MASSCKPAQFRSKPKSHHQLPLGFGLVLSFFSLGQEIRLPHISLASWGFQLVSCLLESLLSPDVYFPPSRLSTCHRIQKLGRYGRTNTNSTSNRAPRVRRAISAQPSPQSRKKKALLRQSPTTILRSRRQLFFSFSRRAAGCILLRSSDGRFPGVQKRI